MAGNLRDLQRLLNRAADQIPDQALRIIEVEGLNFIRKNFNDEGFNDNGLRKWQARKTTDKDGNDLTRYRSNRRGRQGDLTKFGQREIGRAILTGHDTGGDKLRNSWRAKRNKSRKQVGFYTYKGYAEYHNAGTGNLPKRQMIGKSAYLERRIFDKVKRTLDNHFR
ncbi:hypothetical protein [Chryseobacterium daeguense]|uniref:hypothetical protein n=1 Tax=Chryseobacterium daeguense TaxID=412438 RepID=UPI00042935F4|nr:hypothetical protein [Chryseobacterium daeguense]